jgi:hypothetical protein
MGNKASVSERIFAHASGGTRNDAQELSKLLAKLDSEQTVSQSEFGHKHNLLEAKFGPNQQTALLAACASGDTSLQIVQALIAAGALVTTVDLQGNNVFHTAAASPCRNCTRLMDFFLSAAPNRDHDPARNVQAMIPKLRPVIDQGIAMAANNAGQTPLHLARHAKDVRTVRFLEGQVSFLTCWLYHQTETFASRVTKSMGVAKGRDTLCDWPRVRSALSPSGSLTALSGAPSCRCGAS